MESIEKKIMNQADSYVTWVNSQLSKRVNSRLVKDLAKDLNDGVVFLQLVEVISHCEQDIIDGQQITAQEMRQNINGVLQFLSNNNVRVHHIHPKEIIEGNLKTIMRLVLALAAHFKSDSFSYHALNTSTPKHQTARSKMPPELTQRTPSVVSLVSEAAASLAEASKNASKGGGSSLHKYRNQQRFEGGYHQKSINQHASHQLQNHQASKSFTMPHHRPQSTPPSHPKAARAESCEAQRPHSLRLSSTEIPDLSHVFKATRNGRISVTEFPTDGSEIKTKEASIIYTTTREQQKLHGVKRVLIPEADDEDFEQQYELLGLQDSLSEDIGDTREVLEQLQTLLLNGRTTDEMLGLESPRDESFQEQLVVKNIMLENKEDECADLRHQVNEFKEINMRQSSEKNGLELRLSQQEQLILSLKSKLLEYEHPKTPGSSEQELNAVLIEKGKELQLLHQELGKRDEIIEKQKAELDSMSHDIVGKKRSEANLYAKLESSESIVSSLQVQLREASESIHLNNTRGGGSRGGHHNNEETSSKLHDAKMQKFKQKITREHQNLSITLRNIRGNFPNDDPVQHALESMDHSITSLMDTLSLMDANKPSKQPTSAGGGVGGSNRYAHKDRLPLPRNSSRSTKSKSSGVSSDSGFDQNANVALDSPEQVKIVYFLGKTVTPILKTSDIGLGYLTLRDFKELVNRPGKYRYYFKSKDKDFGFVREELLFDDDVVPGYDNKIVSWIERNMAEEV